MTVLIDVTRDFSEQARDIERIDAVLLTHAHRDASGGIPQLRRWCARHARGAIDIYSSGPTRRTLRARYARLDDCHLISASAGQDFRILAFSVGSIVLTQIGKSAPSFATAETVLARGGAVVVFPHGGIFREGEIGVLPKPGVGRLALESGAPVLPAAIRGSHAVGRLRFPRVELVYGAPLRFSREAKASRDRHQQVANTIYAEIRRLYRER